MRCMSEGISPHILRRDVIDIERYPLSPTAPDRIGDDEAMELIRATPAQRKRRGRGGGGPKVTFIAAVNHSIVGFPAIFSAAFSRMADSPVRRQPDYIPLLHNIK